jgi:hypothetical protein
MEKWTVCDSAALPTFRAAATQRDTFFGVADRASSLAAAAPFGAAASMKANVEAVASASPAVLVIVMKFLSGGRRRLAGCIRSSISAPGQSLFQRLLKIGSRIHIDLNACHSDLFQAIDSLPEFPAK